MIYFTLRFDLPRGKESEFEEFLQRAKKFWLSQPGVREFHVYGDVLIDWPERSIQIAVNDRESLDRILESAERRQIRDEMLNYAQRPVWQVLELLENGNLTESSPLKRTTAAT
jgi:hypothetical protein